MVQFSSSRIKRGRLQRLSKKSQIMVTVGVFALIGGGILVYRSFAAVDPGFNPTVYTVADGRLRTLAPSSFDNRITATSRPVTEEKKNRIQVLEMPTGSAIWATKYRDHLWIPENYYYKLCINTTSRVPAREAKLRVQESLTRKGSSKSELVFMVLGDGKPIGGGYYERCTSLIQNRSLGYGEGFDPFTVYNAGPTARVSSFTVKLGQRPFN